MKVMSPALALTSPARATDVIDVLLVDDHVIVRRGLRSILERVPGLRVVAEAATATEALAMVNTMRPRIVLLDLKLSSSSDTEGIDLCAALTARHPDALILVLTTFLDDQLVMKAIRAGARGYVIKDVDTSALVRAVRDVANGGSAFDARSAAAMIRGVNMPTPHEDSELTSREREVLKLLARGLSNRAIGHQLYISDTTAKFHVGNILRKLGVSRRAEAVYEGSKLGLL